MVSPYYYYYYRTDIKAENIMFTSPTPGSDMKLIDFGSGTNEVVPDGGYHTTFAGSAFYVSPEAYQRTYGLPTDVWSAGVTLYVLVAGYPADKLQMAFNMLQTDKRNLRDLPNLPDDMPDSFYDMLDGLLVYKHKFRKTAREMLKHEFVQFHKNAFTVENIMLEAAQVPTSKDALKNYKSKTMSIAIRGSISRHSTFLDYQKYERSLTALLATLMTTKDLKRFIESVQKQLSEKRAAREDAAKADPNEQPQGQTLDIMKIRDMKAILLKEEQDQVLEMIDKLPGGNVYDGFAYDVAVLHYFLGEGHNPGGTYRSQTGSNRQARRASGTGSVSGHRGTFRGSFRGSFRGKSFMKRRNSGNNGSNTSANSFGKSSKGDSSARGRQSLKRPTLKRSDTFHKLVCVFFIVGYNQLATVMCVFFL
jgi:serine/threonine protein kinase